MAEGLDTTEHAVPRGALQTVPRGALQSIGSFGAAAYAIRRADGLSGERLPLGAAPGADPSRLAVAIIGCGYWGINYVRVLSEIRETRVASVCDARPDR